jgi:hypothetical protein
MTALIGTQGSFLPKDIKKIASCYCCLLLDFLLSAYFEEVHKNEVISTHTIQPLYPHILPLGPLWYFIDLSPLSRMS